MINFNWIIFANVLLAFYKFIQLINKSNNIDLTSEHIIMMNMNDKIDEFSTKSIKHDLHVKSQGKIQFLNFN